MYRTILRRIRKTSALVTGGDSDASVAAPQEEAGVQWHQNGALNNHIDRRTRPNTAIGFRLRRTYFRVAPNKVRACKGAGMKSGIFLRRECREVPMLPQFSARM